MRQTGRGTLAGIASVAGFRGLAGNGAYSGSKAAARIWMESLRTELYGSGVSVVCICPGYIDTPMTRVNRFRIDRKSTRLNSSHLVISYAVFCLKKKKTADARR